jgi:hypothetical protein
MRTLYEGTGKRPPKGHEWLWWIGKQFLCYSCRHVAILEPEDLDDAVVSIEDSDGKDTSSIKITCPKCGSGDQLMTKNTIFRNLGLF